MTGNGLSLDHVGFMVRDLDAGAARWRKLGFQLAPRSPQMGATPNGEKMAPWATSNHCVMFARGYLELIGITDPAQHNPWTAFLNRFEGIHITAFRCPDADTAYAELAERVEGFDPPLQRRRDAPYGDGVREFRFRNIFSQDAQYPEGRFIVIEHQTPEVIWQPALMTHPNGAVAFDEVVFRGDEATTQRIAAITGVREHDDSFMLPGGGKATVLNEAAFASRFQGAHTVDTPCVAAAIVAVDALSRLRACLAEAGITPNHASDGTLWVPAEDANGGIIGFKQA
jgi:catechol 2,3-dioxygenase-like lactoylglutathione lyase family enzyme